MLIHKPVSQSKERKLPDIGSERWLKAVASADRNRLDLGELTRLHNSLIADSRFTTVGIRNDVVFPGESDANNYPIPEIIGAKQTDLPTLLRSFFQTLKTLSDTQAYPVLQVTALAFGFAYIHPHNDGKE